MVLLCFIKFLVNYIATETQGGTPPSPFRSLADVRA